MKPEPIKCIPLFQLQEKHFLIQKLDPQTLKIYNKLKKDKKLKETNFSASRSTKVSPGAVIEVCTEYENTFESYELKNDLKAKIIEIDGIDVGNSQIFICHSSAKDTSKLEYICVVVHKYECENGEPCGKCETCNHCKDVIPCGTCRNCRACMKSIPCKQCKICKESKSKTKCQDLLPCGDCQVCKRCRTTRKCRNCHECLKCKKRVACDYLLTAYSYKNTINKTGLGIGISTIVASLIIGGIALPIGIFTGGIGFTIGGAIIAGATTAGGAIGGSAIISNSLDTSISSKLKSFLKACFIYELDTQGYAVVSNDELYCNFIDVDQQLYKNNK
uniref:TNFR-Cys domain-containing protein n=1 Tax=Panagrolaimus sp. JU765 TaxID=591449 RepID=A0AC34RGQ0_9BILA